ncbi:MAG: hypothetical protein Wins2KO_13170 [Winogradskyella sp.]
MIEKNIYENKNNIPLSIHSNLCDNYDVETGGKLKQYSKGQPFEIKQDLGKSFSDLSTKYNEYKKSRLTGKRIIKASSKTIKGAFEFVSAPIKATGIGFFIVKGVEETMNITFENVLQEYDEQSLNEANNLIGKHLQILRDKENIKFEDLSGVSSNEAMKIVFQSDKGVFDNSITSFKNEDKPNVIYHMTKLLETKVTDALALNKLADDARDIEISSLDKSVNKLKLISRSLIQFQSKTEEQIKNIGIHMTEMKTSIDELQSDVNINTEDISILKDFMFNNLDVNQQILAIERGMRGDPELPENKNLKIQLKAFRSKKMLAEELKSYVNGANTLMNIANNLGDEFGIDSEFLKKANDLVDVGSTAINAYLSFSSGNVMGAISQVSNLFGSKKDPATERHKQIMHRLKIIDGKLTHVLDNQQTLIEKQQKIMQLQLDTIKAIGRIAQDIEIKHAKVMEKLDNMHEDLIINRKILQEEAYKDLENLALFVRKYEDKNYKKSNGKLVNYEDRIIHWRSYHPAFLNATEDLWRQLNPHKLGSFLKMESYGKKGDFKYVARIVEIYKSLTSFVEIKKFSNEVMYSGLLATNHLHDLEKKTMSFDNIEEIQVFKWESVKDLISIFHLEIITDLLLKTHEYYMLADDIHTSKLLQIEELYMDNPYKTVGLDLLNDLEKIISIAIIQENIISGDILLGLVYDELIKALNTNQSESTIYDEILDLLDSNKIFKENFTNFLLRQELKKTNTLFIQYEMALTIKDPENSLLKSMFSHVKFKTGIEYSKKKNAWFIRLPKDQDNQSILLFLPNFDKYENGKIKYRSEMERLHRLKNRVIDTILDYENIDILNDYTEIKNRVLSN